MPARPAGAREAEGVWFGNSATVSGRTTLKEQGFSCARVLVEEFQGTANRIHITRRAHKGNGQGKKDHQRAQRFSLNQAAANAR
jgi:hypothetical protein